MPGTPQLDDLVLASTSRTSLVGTYWFGYRVRETFRNDTVPSGKHARNAKLYYKYLPR